MDSPEILRAKVLLKQALAAELKTRIGKIRKADPKLSLEGAYTKARLADPAFFAHLDAIDAGNWGTATNQGNNVTLKRGQPTSSSASLREVLRLPSVIHARNQEDEEELVMAAEHGDASGNRTDQTISRREKIVAMIKAAPHL